MLYHANCPDGFGGAWSVWLARGDAVTYCPVSHGEAPPEIPPDASVLMVDIAYPRDVALALRDRVRELVILDHHKSAQEELGDLDFATFDMDRSGAMMGWNYMHPGEEPPPLIGYVQDRDLWRFELPNSREVTAALGSYPMEFEVWNRWTWTTWRARARRSSASATRRSRRSSGSRGGARSAGTGCRS